MGPYPQYMGRAQQDGRATRRASPLQTVTLGECLVDVVKDGIVLLLLPRNTRAQFARLDCLERGAHIVAFSIERRLYYAYPYTMLYTTSCTIGTDEPERCLLF